MPHVHSVFPVDPNQNFKYQLLVYKKEEDEDDEDGRERKVKLNRNELSKRN